MKLTSTQKTNRKAGMTLIELTVVILVLLALIAVLFVGAKAYKDGADKSACIMNIRNIQQAMRSEANLNNNTLTAGWLVGKAYFKAEPTCPTDKTAATGKYTYTDTTVPDVGIVYATCAKFPALNAAAGAIIHAPNAADTHNW